MNKILVLCIAVATITLMPATAVGQVVVNADIWYDETSNTVYAFNEAYTTLRRFRGLVPVRLPKVIP